MSPEYLEPLPSAPAANAEPDFGELLAGAWALLRAHSAPLLKTWAVTGLPAVAFAFLVSLLLQIDGREDAAQALKDGRVLAVALWFASVVVERIAEALAFGACTLAADDALSGRPCSAGAAWRRLGSRLVPWLATGLVRALWLIVGYALLIVPGILLSIRWTLWSCAVLIEGRSGGDALARSRQIVMPNLIPVLCAAWGSAALAAAVAFFSSMAAAIVPAVLALVVGLATGVGPEEANLTLAVFFAVPNFFVCAAARIWSSVVVLLVWRQLAPRYAGPPERGYFV